MKSISTAHKVAVPNLPRRARDLLYDASPSTATATAADITAAVIATAAGCRGGRRRRRHGGRGVGGVVLSDEAQQEGPLLGAQARRDLRIGTRADN